MRTTRGNLEAAVIYESDKKGNTVSGGVSVPCMFNPFEYTISKTNRFCEKPRMVSDASKGELSRADGKQLRLSLVFDTYETGKDVSQKTNELWKLMLTRTVKEREGIPEEDKTGTPLVTFRWGTFLFTAYITSMTQKFTLFKQDGTPVRAKVDVSFKEYIDPKEEDKQNPTSGGGPIERVWRVIAGDRLDTIAAEVYQDATKWRLIAEHNQIVNPLALRPGQQLSIPVD